MQKTLSKIQTELFTPEIEFVKMEKITFQHAASGTRDPRKGYEFYFRDPVASPNIRWTITIEPCNYSNGDKWLIYGNYVSYFLGSINVYAKNLPQVFNKLSLKK